ncbi:MAG: LysR family transcriptional regulator [Myxococcaceae bacterium]
MKPKTPAWDDLRVLLEVHRTGSFLEAGRQLGLSTSTVARRVEALERQLDRPLLHRTSQGTTLEADALPLVEVAQQFERALAARQRDEQGATSEFAGRVRISVPDGFAAALAEAAARFHVEHPETEIELISEARMVDLAAREADLGVRGQRSTSPALIEKPLGAIASGLFASEAYLARALPSRSLRDADFAAHHFVVEEALPRSKGPRGWLVERGAHRFPFTSNSMAARVHAAKQGLGLVVAHLGVELEHPALVRVALETPLPTLKFYLTMHRDLRKVPRMRGVAAAIEALMAEYLAVQAQLDEQWARRPRR